jgi:hypothetical protein
VQFGEGRRHLRFEVNAGEHHTGVLEVDPVTSADQGQKQLDNWVEALKWLVDTVQTDNFQEEDEADKDGSFDRRDSAAAIMGCAMM